MINGKTNATGTCSTLLAAAIGDDKPAIKRCYGDNSFLDITDLKAFPMTIAKIIGRYALG